MVQVAWLVDGVDRLLRCPIHRLLQLPCLPSKPLAQEASAAVEKPAVGYWG